jgi:secretion/DNA translocation related TadE-like protein
LAGVLTLVGAGSASLAAVAVARQRAAAVADLSALAAAERALQGPAVACARAGRVAQLAGARLRSCTLTGDVADVVAEVRPPGRLGQLGAASARARAGPNQVVDSCPVNRANFTRTDICLAVSRLDAVVLLRRWW